MADVIKKSGLEAPERKIRMTLSSTNLKMLEKITNDFLERARVRNVKAYGPIRMPTKTLRITTRKTPCGEGSKTWSRYQLRLHKRVVDFKGTGDLMEDVGKVSIDPVVTVEITIDDALREKLMGSRAKTDNLENTPTIIPEAQA